MQELEILIPWTWIYRLLAAGFYRMGGGLAGYIRAIIGVDASDGRFGDQLGPGVTGVDRKAIIKMEGCRGVQVDRKLLVNDNLVILRCE
jgi:hypothetical protein